MKEINTEKLRIVGRGVSGDVYALDEDRVVKVFHDFFTEEQVRTAYEVARFIYDSGIPTARAYELISSGGRYGVIYEYLKEPTLFSCVKDGRIDRQTAAAKMGKLLKQVHDIPVNDSIQPLLRMAAGILGHCGDFITRDQKEELLLHIDRFPGKRVLHGDFHEANIFVRGDEYLLVDLDSVCIGSPLFEMEHLFCIYKTGMPKVLTISQEEGCAFLDTLLANYFADWGGAIAPGMLEDFKDIFTAVSAFSVFFSKILRCGPGEEDAVKREIEMDYPKLISAFNEAEARYKILPWSEE